MSDRVLIWHYEGTIRGDGSNIGPTYYLESDYEAVAVRIHAETAPNVEDAKFDIQDQDGVSIFANQTPTATSPLGRVTYTTSTTSAMLPQGENYEEDAEDFKEGINIEEGTWLHCVPVTGGNGKNFTVALELERVG